MLQNIYSEVTPQISNFDRDTYTNIYLILV